jgi:hypothetical protein
VFALEALAGKAGDCLLLHYGNGKSTRYILIDGGPAGVYSTALKPRLLELKGTRNTLPLELAMVSHIDDDHIHGMIDLFKDLNNQREDGVDPLPVTIPTLWHNSFERLLEATKASVATVSPVVQAAAAGVVPAGVSSESFLGAVTQSVKQGNDLRNLATQLKIPLNKGGKGPLMMAATSKLPVLKLAGGLSLTIVGPQQAEIDKLEEEWHKATKSGKAKQAAFAADYLNRTAENLSSIVVLAEFGTGAKKKRMLLTGDAGGDLVMEALERAKLLPAKKPLHVDLLKVMHHGSSHSVGQTFFERVTADRYVISGNGKHGNPHPDTLGWLSAARAGKAYEAFLTYREGEEGLTAHLKKFLDKEKKNEPKHVYHFRDDKALGILVKVA